MFEFAVYDNRVVLRLIIGPGDNDYRELLRKFFFKQKDLFKLVDRTFSAKFHTVYQKIYLTKRDFEEKDNDELKESAGKKVRELFEKDLPKIEKYFIDHWQKNSGF